MKPVLAARNLLTPGCDVCGCSTEWRDGERVCWCDSCKKTGCVHKSGCVKTVSQTDIYDMGTTLTRKQRKKILMEQIARERERKELRKERVGTPIARGYVVYGLGGPCGHGTKRQRRQLRKAWKQKNKY